MPRRNLRRLTFALGAAVLACLALGLVASRFGSFSINLPVERTAFWSAPDAPMPQPLQVNGNKIVAPDGRAVTLRGVMPPDPARLRSDRRFKREFFEGIAATGANVVRIPVHPESWVRDPDYVWRYLDPVVTWTGELGLYVILDWHYIGNIATGEGENMPDIEQEPFALTLEFWRQVASRYAAAPHALFEIWNEPAEIEAAVWRSHAEQILAAIRATGARQVVIVGGTDWSRDLSEFTRAPLTDDQVAYATHVYPAHSAAMWDFWFGRLAESHPVLLTEWGYMDENRAEGPAYLRGNEEKYGAPLMRYAEERGMGWVACWYDDEWLPPMYGKGMTDLTQFGGFIMRELAQSTGGAD
jgi:hypothetical protein